MKIKETLEEIILLPLPVKIAAGVFAAALIIGLIVAGFNNHNLSKKAENLEKANIELELKVKQAESKAVYAEIHAEDEKRRADDLESQLPELETKTKGQDEKIKVQQNNSNDIRRRLDSIRKRKIGSANTNADTGDENPADFERRLRTRYESNSYNQ